MSAKCPYLKQRSKVLFPHQFPNRISVGKERVYWWEESTSDLKISHLLAHKFLYELKNAVKRKETKLFCKETSQSRL